MALFATNISCLHLVSLAQAGYDSGLLMAISSGWPLHAGAAVVVLRPFYIRSKVATLPDFLERRYSPSAAIGWPWL